MKVEELRIGNLVLFNDEICVVSGYSYGFIHMNDNKKGTKIEFIKPIEITEELLLKFGFKENIIENDIYFIYKDSLFAIWNVNDEFNNYFECGKLIYCDSFYSECISTLKFVHQLQNLYFALTNEELNFIE